MWIKALTPIKILQPAPAGHIDRPGAILLDTDPPAEVDDAHAADLIADGLAEEAPAPAEPAKKSKGAK